MTKEQLKKYLEDKPLMEVIREKLELDDTRKKLFNARDIAVETNLSKSVTDEIEARCGLYSKIISAHSNMLEDIWGITWQTEDIITKYMNLTDREIDELPDVLKD